MILLLIFVHASYYYAYVYVYYYDFRQGQEWLRLPPSALERNQRFPHVAVVVVVAAVVAVADKKRPQ